MNYRRNSSEKIKIIEQIREIFSQLNFGKNAETTIKDDGIYIDIYGYEGEHAQYFTPFYKIAKFNNNTAYHCIPGKIYIIGQYTFDIRTPIGSLENHEELRNCISPHLAIVEENYKDLQECISRCIERNNEEDRKEIEIYAILIRLQEWSDYKEYKNNFEETFEDCLKGPMYHNLLEIVNIDIIHKIVHEMMDGKYDYLWNKILEKITGLKIVKQKDNPERQWSDWLCKDGQNWSKT